MPENAIFVFFMLTDYFCCVGKGKHLSAKKESDLWATQMVFNLYFCPNKQWKDDERAEENWEAEADSLWDDELRASAKAQVNRYADSEIVRSSVKHTQLHKVVVLYRSIDMVRCEEVF